MLRYLLSLSLLLFLTNPVTAMATDIRIAGGNYCPYACNDPTNPGLGIELLQLSLAGSDYRIQRVTNLPWMRDINTGSRATNSGNKTHAVMAITPPCCSGDVVSRLPHSTEQYLFFHPSSL